MKIGVVGTGIFATDSHLPAFKEAGDIEVVSAYNRTKSKAVVFAQTASGGSAKVHDSIDELLKDPEVEAVDGLLPVDTNLLLVQKAISAGKPLAFEKPIAHNLEDAKKIVELAKNSDLPIMVLENWCYHNRTLKLQELLPRIGKVATFLYQTTGSFFLSKYHQTAWRQNPTHIGGFISDGGVHDIALITEVLGKVSEVNARAAQLHKESGDIDTLIAQLVLESGAFGSFTYAKAFGATTPVQKFQIFGTEGTLILDFSKDQPSKIVLSTGPDGDNMTTETFDLAPEPVNGVVAEFQNFKQAVKSGDKSLILSTPEKAYHHFATIVACVESSQQNGATTSVQ